MILSNNSVLQRILTKDISIPWQSHLDRNAGLEPPTSLYRRQVPYSSKELSNCVYYCLFGALFRRRFYPIYLRDILSATVSTLTSHPIKNGNHKYNLSYSHLSFCLGGCFWKSAEFKISQADNRNAACNQSFTRPNNPPENTVRQAITVLRESARHPSVCIDQLHLQIDKLCSLLQHGGLESMRKRASKISIMCHSLLSTSELV